MAHALRITFPGAFCHITSRGNERKATFKSKRDQEKFLECLESSTLRYDVRIQTYCLMDNHYKRKSVCSSASGESGVTESCRRVALNIEKIRS